MPDRPLTYHVSPMGDDSQTGTADTPWRSLPRVLRALREAGTNEPERDVEVVLGDGTWYLDSVLRITNAEAGSQKGRRVSWRAAEGATPVISGGRRITGWTETTVHGRLAWQTTIPEVKTGRWNFHHLTVNGEARRRPRLPETGLYRIEELPDVDEGTFYRDGQRRFVYREGDLQAWTNLADVEVVALSFWTESRMWIESLDAATRMVTLDRPSCKRLTDDQEQKPTEYYVENVWEALRQPGQWYLDRPTGVLTYLPLPGETPESCVVEAPRLGRVLLLDGVERLGRVIENIHFKGIAFAHSEHELAVGESDTGQSANEVPGGVQVNCTVGCSFQGCRFEHLGGYAVALTDSCQDVRVMRCTVTDSAAGGVKVWHGCSRCEVTDCEIAHGSRRYLCGAGVLVGQASGIQVIHNHIHDFGYSGVSVGWMWGYRDSRAHGNVVEYNHIHDIGRGELSDMGGIYTLGVSGGTRLRHNHIHHIHSRGYGGWAIYPDEGSTGLLIEGNLCHDTNCASFHQHYGRENVVQNNVFAFGGCDQVALTKLEAHRSFVFRRNLVVFDRGVLFGYRLGEASPAVAAFDHNLYWRTDGKPVAFGEKTLAEWQAGGQDAGSVEADPGFADAAGRDFSLGPDSPALALGFVPIDLTLIGPRNP